MTTTISATEIMQAIAGKRALVEPGIRKAAYALNLQQLTAALRAESVTHISDLIQKRVQAAIFKN